MIALVERLRRKHGNKRKLENVKRADFKKSNNITNMNENKLEFNATIGNGGVTTIKGGVDNNDTESNIGTTESNKPTKLGTNNSEVISEPTERKKP